MEIEQNSLTAPKYLKHSCAETLHKDVWERREHSWQRHNSGTQQRNVPSGNRAPRTQGPARCRCVCMHTLAGWRAVLQFVPLHDFPGARCSRLEDQGWSPIAVSGSSGGKGSYGIALQMHQTGPQLWRIVQQEPIIPAWSSAFESVMLLLPVRTARKLKMFDCAVFPLNRARTQTIDRL